MPLSNLAARILVALVAIPVVVAAVWTGGVVLALLLAIVAGIAAWEMFRIAAPYEPMARLGIALAVLIPIAVWGYQRGRFTPPPLTLGAVVLLATFALAIFVRGVDRRPVGATAVTLFVAAYTGGMLAFAYGLRYHNYTVGTLAGAVLLLYPLVLTWVSDTAAFFVGRAIGRRKLIPRVSPGKTVEGAVGALVFTMLASWFYARFVLVPYAQLGVRPAMALFVGLVISVAVQLGDLAESLAKREGGVKDSSHLIPGHGGVLDRIDSLLFAIPTAYLLFSYPGVLLPVVR